MLRKLILACSAFFLVIIGSESGCWAYEDWTQPRPGISFGDRFAIATLAITFLAVVFALLAYMVSTPVPNLELKMMLQGGNRDKLSLKYKTDSERRGKLKIWFESDSQLSGDPGFLWTGDSDINDHIAYMWIRNKSRSPARRPAVIVRFGNGDHSPMGLCWTQPESYNLDGPSKDRTQGPAWKGAEFRTPGTVVLAAQWDGGSEYTVHGRSERRLPDLPLVTLFSKDLVSKFKVELLAENYRRVVDVAIVFDEADANEPSSSVN